MIVNVNEAEDQVLNYLVAKCQGEETILVKGRLETLWTDNGYKPSTDWAQGGPIIERQGISLECDEFARWHANDGWSSDAPLLAAMRCYVASKLGDEVEVPDEWASSVEYT